MNGIRINQTVIHLKKLRLKGGISNKVANFPTIKLPDQKKEKCMLGNFLTNYS